MTDGPLHALLGCEWGRAVRTEDDPLACGARAVQIVVLHGGELPGGERTVKLCAHHRDRVLAETTPTREARGE